MAIFVKRLRAERIKERWSTLIADGQGRGEKLLQEIKHRLEAAEVPNISMTIEDVKADGFLSLDYKKHPFLVVRNNYIKGVEILMSARNYGKQLTVSWYLTEKASPTSLLADNMPEHPIGALIFMPLAVISKLMGLVKDKMNNTVRAENMNIFDSEELTAYATTCHHALLESVEQLMVDLNQDFSKVDTKSRGILNIS
jgi:hypothetical protein